MENVIEVSHLHKNYGKFAAVRDISFSVKRGEIFGLLGRNGAGKTTTVECLQGLRHYDQGIVSVLGLNPITEAPELRKRIGCQLQEAALPDRVKVWEALKLFASLNNSNIDWRKLLRDWGLEEKVKSTFASLSGGQRQRLFVALALVNNPEVVFLDEMTTGLDPAARRVAWGLIREIRNRGTTVVLVTHFMDEAEELCDRLAIVDIGTIVAMDAPRALINNYADEVRVIFTTDMVDISWLKDVPKLKRIERTGSKVIIGGGGALLALVAAKLVEHGIVPVDLHLEQPSLEDVFLKLTDNSGAKE
jgi:ABC-2 type transport system ATP-binding protein